MTKMQNAAFAPIGPFLKDTDLVDLCTIAGSEGYPQ